MNLVGDGWAEYDEQALLWPTQTGLQGWVGEEAKGEDRISYHCILLQSPMLLSLETCKLCWLCCQVEQYECGHESSGGNSLVDSCPSSLHSIVDSIRFYDSLRPHTGSMYSTGYSIHRHECSIELIVLRRVLYAFIFM